MVTEEKIIEIIKQFEQKDYKRGGVSIDPSNYNAIARTVVKNCSIPDVSNSEVSKKVALDIWENIRDSKIVTTKSNGDCFTAQAVARAVNKYI